MLNILAKVILLAPFQSERYQKVIGNSLNIVITPVFLITIASFGARYPYFSPFNLSSLQPIALQLICLPLVWIAYWIITIKIKLKIAEKYPVIKKIGYTIDLVVVLAIVLILQVLIIVNQFI